MRRAPLALLAVVFAAGAFGLYRRREPRGGSAAPAAAGSQTGVASDARVALLLAGCERDEHYSGDTSDLPAILAQKLVLSETEVLKRSKEELGAGDDAALQEVQRLFERSYSDPVMVGPLQNALDVAVRSDAPAARAMCRQAMLHPREMVRSLALSGMADRHATPEDYDALLLALERESVQMSHAILAALQRADAGRAEAEFAHWLAEGRWPGMAGDLATLLVDSKRPETAEACRALWPEALPVTRSLLAGQAARAGDAAALDDLRAEAANPDPARRARAIQGFGAAELSAELGRSLAADPDADVRLLALSVLGTMPDSPDVRASLARALVDTDRRVMEGALRLLCERGDGAARDQALSMLGADLEDLGTAARAARGAWIADEGYAHSALAALERRLLGQQGLALLQKKGTLQALGLVPLAAAAELLRSEALAHEGELVEGKRAHEWLMIMASNTGDAGRLWLASELAGERDPLRRLDLIWAATTQRCPIGQRPGDACVARDVLLALVDDPSTEPYELLFCADRLALVGPAAIVAAHIKRATLRIDQDDVRRALQCVLWRWY